jgi:hypothetical protein
VIRTILPKRSGISSGDHSAGGMKKDAEMKDVVLPMEAVRVVCSGIHQAPADTQVL